MSYRWLNSRFTTCSIVLTGFSRYVRSRHYDYVNFTTQEPYGQKTLYMDLKYGDRPRGNIRRGSARAPSISLLVASNVFHRKYFAELRPINANEGHTQYALALLVDGSN